MTMICPNCGFNRVDDLREPCPNCGSRKCIFGYLRPSECCGLRVALIIVGSTLILTILALAIMYLVLNGQLASLSSQIAA